MDKSKDAVDRVRPILQAMERSIDAARRRRTDGDDEEPIAARETGQDEVRGAVDPDTAARMRARPKRPRGFDDVIPARPANPAPGPSAAPIGGDVDPD